MTAPHATPVGGSVRLPANQAVAPHGTAATETDKGCNAVGFILRCPLTEPGDVSGEAHGPAQREQCTWGRGQCPTACQEDDAEGRDSNGRPPRRTDSLGEERSGGHGCEDHRDPG